MDVMIQPLRRSENFLAALRADGWTIESGQDGAVCVRHPLASDEEAVRSRLYDLGLLTASFLRIEFCHTGPRKGARQNARSAGPA
jgi:hypothetical protein